MDHFVVLGKQHLDYLVQTYVSHFLTERPHQGIGNVRVIAPTAPPDEVPAPSDVVCDMRLGGLLKSYRRKAA